MKAEKCHLDTCIYLKVKVLVTSSHLTVTQWTAACEASLSLGFSRHEHWSGWLYRF